MNRRTLISLLLLLLVPAMAFAGKRLYYDAAIYHLKGHVKLAQTKNEAGKVTIYKYYEDGASYYGVGTKRNAAGYPISSSFYYYYYDSKNRLIKYEAEFHYSQSWSTTYEYDRNGNMVKKTTVWDDGLTDVVTYDYKKFDSHGNPTLYTETMRKADNSGVERHTWTAEYEYWPESGASSSKSSSSSLKSSSSSSSRGSSSSSTASSSNAMGAEMMAAVRTLPACNFDFGDMERIVAGTMYLTATGKFSGGRVTDIKPASGGKFRIVSNSKNREEPYYLYWTVPGAAEHKYTVNHFTGRWIKLYNGKVHGKDAHAVGYILLYGMEGGPGNWKIGLVKDGKYYQFSIFPN